MKKILRKTTMVGAMATTAVMLAAPAAMAAGPLTIGGSATPAGAVAITATNVGNFSFVTDYGVPATCTTATISGSINRGTAVVNNAVIGKISSLTFSGCTATALNYPVTITKTGTDWDLVVDGTPASGAVANLKITNVSAQMRSTGSAPYACDLTAASSSVPGSFNPTTQRLSVNAVSGVFPLALTAAGGVTCGGQIYTGDQAQMSGVFAVSTGGAGSINY